MVGILAIQTKLRCFMYHWGILSAAIFLEVAGTTAMKLSDGFSKLTPTALMIVLYAASFTALAFAIKKIEVSVAYAVWSGAGTALIAAVGMMYFREAFTLLKVFSIFLIIAGVFGLNLAGVKN